MHTIAKLSRVITKHNSDIRAVLNNLQWYGDKLPEEPYIPYKDISIRTIRRKTRALSKLDEITGPQLGVVNWKSKLYTDYEYTPDLLVRENFCRHQKNDFMVDMFKDFSEYLQPFYNIKYFEGLAIFE